MFNFRKLFGLAPYNRPAPTVEDLKGNFRTVGITTPKYGVLDVPLEDGRYAIVDTGDGNVIRTYSTKANALRGLSRLGG